MSVTLPAPSTTHTDSLEHTGAVTSAQGAFDEELLLRRIVPVTHDVTSFVFEAPTGAPLRFDPGQHVRITVTVDGQELQRSFTIASPPTRPAGLTLTIKRHPGGVVTSWLHERLRTGDRVRVQGPFGAFSCRGYPATPTLELPGGGYLFLSAGSGITPLMSMARTLADEGSDADIAFVHSARTPADIIFRRETAALAESGLSLRALTVCETDSVAERWEGPRGRLGRDLLRWAVPDAADREVFLCGPAGYMDATRQLLLDLGVVPERIHQESFTVAEPVAPAPASGTARTVQLRRSGRTVSCDEAHTVLETLEAAGVRLPSSCRQGMCGTCKLTLVEGRVDMAHQGGIRPREIQRGGFLPCCSRPETDLVIDA